MYSFTIAAVVLITGVSGNGYSHAEFRHVKNTLEFSTLEECKEAYYLTNYSSVYSKAAATVGHVQVTECEELK